MAKRSSSEELINHYGLVRFRVTGFGRLLLRLISLGEVRENVMFPITMVDPTDIEPTRLSNFTQQRACLEIKTVNFGEYFEISKLIVFAKPIAKSYPG